MLIEIDFFRNISVWVVLIRLTLAAVAGGLVGLERELHGRPAGLRTHMMVSLGGALTVMIGLFNVQFLGVTWADPMRIGAQVVSGISFLGAGVILLKRSNLQITGLTTAAGLWTTAIIGLAIGCGFYEGALTATALAVLIFAIVNKLERAMNSKRVRMYVYMELENVDAVKEMMVIMKNNFSATELQVLPPRTGISPHVGMEGLIFVPKSESRTKKIEALQELKNVVFAYQL